jgi:hypothetical protein
MIENICKIAKWFKIQQVKRCNHVTADHSCLHILEAGAAVALRRYD